MPGCFVRNCKNRSSALFKKKVKFNSFPHDPKLKVKWLEACNKDSDCNTKYAQVCEVHFSPDCYDDSNQKGKRKLKVGSVPTEFLQLPKRREKQINISSAESISTGVPTYEQLVHYAKEKDAIPSEPAAFTELSAYVKMECIDFTHSSEVPPYDQLVDYANEAKEKDAIPSEPTPFTELPACVKMECIESTHSTEVPIYDQLVHCENGVKRKDAIPSDPNAFMELPAYVKMECIDSTHSTGVPTYDQLVHCSNEAKVQDAIPSKSAAFTELEEENAKLKRTIMQLKASLDKSNETIECMKQDLDSSAEEMAANILRQYFTRGQVKQMVSQKGRIRWSMEDISSAISLRSVSARAYNYLREVRKIPLPCVSTLRNWISEFKVEPGFLHEVFNIMKIEGEHLTTAQKLTVLTFNELGVGIERRDQKVNKTYQVVMVRGLFSKWKQPIFYDFFRPISKHILFDILKSLHEAGYTVVGMASDTGPTSMTLWEELNIGISTEKTLAEEERRCFFNHPSDSNLKVFVFANVPHLIKLLRDNLFDSGFTIDGEMFDKSFLEELLKLNSKDLKLSFNLSRDHLDATGFQRQRVKLAAQIFSATNAKCIQYCSTKGHLSKKNWQGMSDLLMTINNWFDIVNSQRRIDKHSGSKAYGIDLKNQNDILDKTSNLVLNMRVGKKKRLVPFQKGILLTNASLKQFLSYLKENYSDGKFRPQYILTRRLCHDVLENFFFYIRAMGASSHVPPTPVDFKNRLKWYILGKHTENAVSARSKTETDEAVPLINYRDFICDNEESIFASTQDLETEATFFLHDTISIEDSGDEENEESDNDENTNMHGILDSTVNSCATVTRSFQT